MKKSFDQQIREEYNLSEDLYETILDSSNTVSDSNKKMIRITDENVKHLESFIQDVRSINRKLSLPRVVNAILNYHFNPKK